MKDFLSEYVPPDVGEAHRAAMPGGIESVRKMIKCASKHESRTLVALIGLVGAQINEARAIRMKHLDMEQRIVHIPGVRHRRVPISPEAWEAIGETVIRNMTDPESFLVPYGDRTARKVVTDLALSAGINAKVATNNLRLVFAEAVALKSGNQKTAQAILGLGISEGNLEQMREAVDFR